ncbi:MAG: glycerophosphodiester phosphodiesterase family protein [Burkholderiaceae bacterium]|nr:glycerophosphodiester phosphodiesterase family protein [Burkholderiaceae bacterium]
MINRLNQVCGALLAAASVAMLPLPAQASDNERDDRRGKPAHYDDDGRKGQDEPIQLGPRPFYLVDGMEDGPLKHRLMQCKDGPFRRTDFSIGHRGAALQFPEHTKESYEAGARQGAGIVECDVTFTKDGHLVCRHAENDLHTTTNILVTPLAEKCTKKFTPATFAPDGTRLTPASAECRASDLTLAEFKSLTGKMDASNANARTPAEYLGGTASWRTDLYTGRGTLMTLRESIELNQMLGVKHTPELKESVVDPATGKKRIEEVFKNPTTRTPQENYAQAFADTLAAAGVRPRDAWAQSFNVDDVLYWVKNTRYGRQAVYLLDYDATDPVNDIVVQPPYNQMDRMAYFHMLKRNGVRIIAPPVPALLAVDANGRVVPSKLARDLKTVGFDIITWTLERSDLRKGAAAAPGNPTYYFDFDPNNAAIRKDSDVYKALDVLAREVKVLGIFSDWPATVTYYANCMGLK